MPNDELIFVGLSQLGVWTKAILCTDVQASCYHSQAHSLHCGRDGCWAKPDSGTCRETCPYHLEMTWGGGTGCMVPLAQSSYFSPTAIPRATHSSPSLQQYP